jgi:hypothetical protein
MFNRQKKDFGMETPRRKRVEKSRSSRPAEYVDVNKPVRNAFEGTDTTPTLIRPIPPRFGIERQGRVRYFEMDPINILFNSESVFIGKKGTRKTVCALKEGIAISLTGQFHLFVYVCFERGNCQTNQRRQLADRDCIDRRDYSLHRQAHTIQEDI